MWMLDGMLINCMTGATKVVHFCLANLLQQQWGTKLLSKFFSVSCFLISVLVVLVLVLVASFFSSLYMTV